MKINFHLVNACNFRCKHCFDHFGIDEVLPVRDWEKIVDTCLADGRIDSFNLAGGEPLLYQGLPELVNHIVESGAKCSIITNGSLLTPDWCRTMGQKLDTLGVSIDTFDPERARIAGRVDRNGVVLRQDFVAEMFRILRTTGCATKVNTVVSDLNCEERTVDAIDQLGVSRWKILKMMPFQANGFSNKGIGENKKALEQFLRVNGLDETFRRLEKHPNVALHVRRNQAGVCPDIIIEPTLESSYLIVNPRGELCRDDAENGEKQPVGSLLKEPFQACFNRLPWNQNLYQSRY